MTVILAGVLGVVVGAVATLGVFAIFHIDGEDWGEPEPEPEREIYNWDVPTYLHRQAGDPKPNGKH